MNASIERRAPELSVVVVGARPRSELFANLEPELSSGRVEVIVSAGEQPDETVAARAGVAVVRSPARATVPRLRARGFERAQAPLVAITEDFCVPARGWASALITGWRQLECPAAVGGPVDRDLGSAAEWALTLREHGPFMRRDGGRETVARLSSINVAYDRAALTTALGGRPEELFEIEAADRLLASGGRLWWLPEALVWDRSRCRLSRAAVAQYHHGRLYAGQRGLGAGPGERLVRAALTPILPLVLGARSVRPSLAAGRGAVILRALPALTLLLGAWSAGEAVGLIAGSGRSLEQWRPEP